MNMNYEYLRCIGQKLTPVSIKLKPNHKVSTSARKIIEKTGRHLMQDRGRGINRVIEASDNNRDNNRVRLVSLVTSTDLERCGNFIKKLREERYNRVKVRQVRKFQILYGKSRQHSSNNVIDLNTNRSSQGVNANRLGQSNNRPNHNSQSEGIGNNKWVINLSKTSLTQAQKSVLAKGTNYPITPCNIPNIDYIRAIDQCVPNYMRMLWKLGQILIHY